ncbi:hypothetical protein MesoLjLb_74220 [Mesorhizobium sp. L-8-3]|nr:hypothetical protein MesoLjLb_74220 [Mesorhizobium sp. L-8-3]
MARGSTQAFGHFAPEQSSATARHGFSGHLRLAALACGPENDEGGRLLHGDMRISRRRRFAGSAIPSFVILGPKHAAKRRAK